VISAVFIDQALRYAASLAEDETIELIDMPVTPEGVPHLRAAGHYEGANGPGRGQRIHEWSGLAELRRHEANHLADEPQGSVGVALIDNAFSPAC